MYHGARVRAPPGDAGSLSACAALPCRLVTSSPVEGPGNTGARGHVTAIGLWPVRAARSR